MKKLQATNDKTKYALIDDDIAEIIKDMGLKFCRKKGGNNIGHFSSTKQLELQGMKKKKCLGLHVFVYIMKTGVIPTTDIDHIDGCPENNCFSNLRMITHKQNSQHRKKRKDNTSNYIGVSVKHDKRGNGYYYWYTHIQKPDGRSESKHFPYTDEGKIAAARWRDAKVREYYKEFAVTNFPDETA